MAGIQEQKSIRELRQKYEECAHTELSVKLLGNTCPENLELVLADLVEIDMPSKSIGDQVRFEVKTEAGVSSPLIVYATKAFRSCWIHVNDSVGWVKSDPIEDISHTIQQKAEKLPRYRECADLSDIRLLIIADRTRNSGKLQIQDLEKLNTQGFNAVYFFSYPETIHVF